MNLTQQYRWNENVEAIEMEGQWVILHAEHNTITKLNELGGKVWSLLREGHGVESIVSILVNEFEVNAEQARADVETFLTELETVDVIVSES